MPGTEISNTHLSPASKCHGKKIFESDTLPASVPLLPAAAGRTTLLRHPHYLQPQTTSFDLSLLPLTRVFPFTFLSISAPVTVFSWLLKQCPQPSFDHWDICSWRFATLCEHSFLLSSCYSLCCIYQRTYHNKNCERRTTIKPSAPVSGQSCSWNITGQLYQFTTTL